MASGLRRLLESNPELWAKNYPTAKKFCSGRIFIGRRNNYPGSCASGPKIRFFSKKSHSAENCPKLPKIHDSISYYIARPFAMLIHYQKHYLHALSRTIPYLDTFPKLYPILIHCQNIPYLNTWPRDASRLSNAIAFLNTWGSPTPRLISSAFYY